MVREVASEGGGLKANLKLKRRTEVEPALGKKGPDNVEYPKKADTHYCHSGSHNEENNSSTYKPDSPIDRENNWPGPFVVGDPLGRTVEKWRVEKPNCRICAAFKPTHALAPSLLPLATLAFTLGCSTTQLVDVGQNLLFAWESRHCVRLIIARSVGSVTGREYHILGAHSPRLRIDNNAS
jgi:hypothetical protein